MDTQIGIIKEVDRLGRLVIPKEMRKRFHLDKEVELLLTTEGILLRNPRHKQIQTAEADRTEK